MSIRVLQIILISFKYMFSFKLKGNKKNSDIVRKKVIKFPPSLEKTDEIFINKAISIVKQRIDDPRFKKDEFARNMNVSPSLLYVRIKNLTNLSPTDFVKSIRLDYSLVLLESGEYSVTEISEKIGFSYIGYFSTVFKKYYGISPSRIITKRKNTIDVYL